VALLLERFDHQVIKASWKSLGSVSTTLPVATPM
jgi:hypothetical protein